MPLLALGLIKMKKQLNFYNDFLIKLEKNHSKRCIKDIVQDGKFIHFNNKKLLNLSSNDYLGISTDDDIKDNFLSKYNGKIQNPSARLLGGTNKVYLELEDLLSSLFKKESCLLFNSGYHANVGIYSSLLSKEDVVFIDKLNHASIIDGIKLSGAKIIPFSHTNYNDLEEKLKKYRNNFKNSIISSESLFSMDGDFCNLEKLIGLKEKYNSLLFIDEAHSFGVFGNGIGYCREKNQLENIDLIMGTFGKAIGSYGAFAVGDKVLIDYLINCARSFIFSTALPEISVSYSKYIIENHILSNKLQEELFEITNYTHDKFKNLKILGNSYIIPIVQGDNEKSVNLSNKLIENGFYILPIRYPTVKKGSERIRISLNSKITKNEINKLFEIIKGE